MSDFIGDWNALLVLLLAGFLPNEAGGCSGFGSAVASTRVRTAGLGEGGGDRDPGRRHRANSGPPARRAGQRAGVVALRGGGRRIPRLHRGTAVDFCRRGVRRDSVMLAGKWWLG